MSLHDYELIKLENQVLIEQSERLKKENVVFFSINPKNVTWYDKNVYRLSGEIVDKDESLKRIQGHLDAIIERGNKREQEYQERIKEYQERIKELESKTTIVQKLNPWYKLFK